MFCWYLDPISMEFEELNKKNIMYVRISHVCYSYGNFSKLRNFAPSNRLAIAGKIASISRSLCR